MLSSQDSTARSGLTYRDTTAFYLPLIFMAELMMVSHSIIHAILARQPQPQVTLAAFSIAFSIHTTMASFVVIMTVVAISHLTDRPAFFRLARFGWSNSTFSAGFTLLVALTPLGDAIYGGLLGASAEVTRQAKETSLVLAFIPPIVVVRQLYFGLVMRNRRTVLITMAAGVRLVSLVIVLFLVAGVLDRAAAGGVALLAGIATETLFVMVMARPMFQALPTSSVASKSYREIVQFSWPLTVNQIGENGLAVVINFFLGRLLRADLALAAFGVVRGLVMLLASPLRNLTATGQALAKTREDLRVLLGFATGVVAVFTSFFLLLFYTPMREVVLEKWMGLTPELVNQVAPAMMAAVAVPVLWGMSASFRGLVISRGKTGTLATTAAARAVVVVSIGATTLAWPTINGAVVGVAALMGAYGAEGAILAWRLFMGGPGGASIKAFPGSLPVDAVAPDRKAAS